MALINIFGLKDERSVIGMYKAANLTDKDAIYSQKEQIVYSLKMLKYLFIFFYVWLTLGLSVSVVLFSLSVGLIFNSFVPMIIVVILVIAIWFYLLKLGLSFFNTKELLIESATESYMKIEVK